MNVHSPALARPGASISGWPALEAVAEVDRADVESDERPLSVLVVHEHDVVRSGFRLLLARRPWIRRCLGAKTAQEAVALWMRYEPQLALVDLFVGETPGTDLCAQLRQLRPQAKVLLMSSTERLSAAAAIAAGAAGFISTGASADDLALVVRRAGLGKTVSQKPAVSFRLLSARQRDVLRLMAAGATNNEIARTLCLSPHTVKGHTTAVYRRLGVRNRAGAVRRAQQVGLLA